MIPAFIITDDITYRNYESLLCKVLAWYTPIEIAEQYIKKIHKRILEFSYHWEKNANSIMEYTLYDYYQYLFYKFSQLRIDSPSLVSNFGFNSTNKENIIKVVELTIDTNNDWYTCPMRMNNGDENLFTSIKNIQYSWLLIELLKSNIIRENILSRKALSKESFPFIVKPGIKEFIIESFKQLYSINLCDLWV